MPGKFTYDPTTPAGRVRLLIGDTAYADGAFRFDDAEVDALLAMADNDVDLAASLAFRNMAARLSTGGAVEVKVGPVTEKFDASKLNEIADRLAKRAAERAGATEIVDVLDLEIDRFGRDASEYVDDPL